MATEYIWVSEGGESCCAKHGGSTLAAAVDAQEWRRIPGGANGVVEMITTRNHWIGWPVGTQLMNPMTEELEEVTCEYCDREEAA